MRASLTAQMVKTTAGDSNSIPKSGRSLEKELLPIPAYSPGESYRRAWEVTVPGVPNAGFD